MFKVIFVSFFYFASIFGHESVEIPIQEVENANSACIIDIHTQTASPQPIFLIPGTSNPFYPANRQGQIQMNAGQQMELFCSSAWTNFPGAPNLISASCVSGQTFNYAGTNFNFNQFRCNAWPAWTTRRTSTRCFGNGFLVDVGFQVGTRWIQVFTSCHDLTTEQNYFTIYNFSPISDASQRNVERPRFTNPEDFFPGRNVDNMMRRNDQRNTIANILGSSSQAAFFIEADPSDVFLARGHIAAMTDFIYGWEQQATFNFINAAPQWQTFNGGNWVSVEISSRRLAADRNINLEVYTGTHGVTNLWTESRQWREIFIDWPARRIPVPQIYYKILVHRATNSGVVLIGVNNFHLTLSEIFSRGYVVCNDVADQIHYVSWSRTNLRRGYGYACTVADFLRAVPHVGGLGTITRLLT